MQKTSIDASVEAICIKGCREVRRDIQLMEDGKTPPELTHHTKQAQQLILEELKVIMSVYGDNCRI
ncbi:MAG: hypothetical protein OQL10_09375 [Sedimenticola sp.]|uniref:Uncharacterized protein n=1 Tax=Sedimenticola thiotaurini TaxID=1543721 RepID=A0A558D5V7_9GAMM|nr:hypothetical protein [Sedimenticola sp.]MCW8947609.1 hypothetical protein [Sedimenticola sp.]MCW8975916.1 hypothetical protein [Sedimenticola sp.]TVT56390.1 MAG: hypothetical protein FHK82_07250 [Sedimenticola thiotaurini]